jgi:Zn-finger nucleic acid-binding protein
MSTPTTTSALGQTAFGDHCCSCSHPGEKNYLSNACPKCNQPLEPTQVDNYQMRLCRACQGVLLAHADLSAILESSWRAVTPEAAEKVEFRASEAPEIEPKFRCPDCGNPMEKYGYMGMTAITIDRCDRCEIVWLDSHELESMVVALARDNYRSRRAVQREHENSRDYLSVGAGPTEDNGTWNTGMVAVEVLLRLLKR